MNVTPIPKTSTAPPIHDIGVDIKLILFTDVSVQDKNPRSQVQCYVKDPQISTDPDHPLYHKPRCGGGGAANCDCHAVTEEAPGSCGSFESCCCCCHRAVN